METVQNKKCISDYLDMPVIRQHVSSSLSGIGDNNLSLRIFQHFLANKTADPKSFPYIFRKNEDILYAVKLGRLSVVKWLWSMDDHIDPISSYVHESCCFLAAERGHLEVLQWLHEKGFIWDTRTCEKAAKNGHLDCLKWARENGCHWDKWTCNSAAKNGHLDCLKWARENGCPWDEGICLYAAERGQLDCLKWARENGCHWDKFTCILAAKNGHLDCLEWARENGCPE